MPIEVGRNAPGFALRDENGNVVKLSEYEGRRVVVFFFPKAMTPG
jgi:peroxiredoxin Q/BCP